MIESDRIPELLGLLTSPVTGFDCGTLCAPGNGGTPVCCHAPSVIPVLYKAELAYFRKRTRLWRRYVPRGRQERERHFVAGASRSLRRSIAQKRLPVPVFTREGIRMMATTRAALLGRRATARA